MLLGELICILSESVFFRPKKFTLFLPSFLLYKAFSPQENIDQKWKEELEGIAMEVDLANTLLCECCSVVPIILVKWIFNTDDGIILAEAFVCVQ